MTSPAFAPTPLILHDLPGRLRIRYPLPAHERPRLAVALERMAGRTPGLSVTLSLRTGNALVCYSTLMGRDRVHAMLSAVELSGGAASPAAGSAPGDHGITGRVLAVAARRSVGVIAERLCPAPLRPLLAALHCLADALRLPGVAARLGWLPALGLAALHLAFPLPATLLAALLPRRTDRRLCRPTPEPLLLPHLSSGNPEYRIA